MSRAIELDLGGSDRSAGASRVGLEECDGTRKTNQEKIRCRAEPPTGRAPSHSGGWRPTSLMGRNPTFLFCAYTRTTDKIDYDN